MHFRIVETQWSCFGFVAHDDHLLATFLPRSEDRVREEIARHWPDARESKSILQAFAEEVDDYFQGHPTDFHVKLDLDGFAPFQRKVLEACRRIPYGQTRTYGELARIAGNPGAARAAGTAMANNRIPLIIPCHRVLRSGGGLGGFSSERGVGEKRRLLRLEGVLFGGPSGTLARTAGFRLPQPSPTKRAAAF